METQDKLASRIQENESSLKSRYPMVRECRVSVEDRPPHRYERRRYNARLEIRFAGHEIVINREHDDDPGTAVDQAFAAARRQLERLES